MAKKKLTSGDGWSFEPAGGTREPERIASLPPEKQKVRLALEKRPKGKEVTLVSGLVLSDQDRKALAKQLKNVCGAGGGDGGDAIEIQGDHRERIKVFMAGKGWSFR